MSLGAGLIATITYRTYLMVADSAMGPYTKLIDIKDLPDLGGAPEMVDVTTLSHGQTINIQGIQAMDAFDFTANFTPESFEKLQDMKGQPKYFSVWFGIRGSADDTEPSSEWGRFDFEGTVAVWASGGGVNDPRNININIAASTEVIYSAS